MVATIAVPWKKASKIPEWNEFRQAMVLDRGESMTECRSERGRCR